MDKRVVVAYVFECTAAGDFEDICDCTRYYTCSGQGATPVVTSCSAGTVYDAANTQACNGVANVPASECESVSSLCKHTGLAYQISYI